METTRLLVVNCGGKHVSESLVDSVANLNGAARFEVKELVAPLDAERWKSVLSKAMPRIRPDVLLVAFLWQDLKVAEKLLEVVRSDFGEVPTIAATDVSDPDGLYKLLQLGASDFLTPPFRVTDLAARLWRLRRHASGDLSTRRLKEKLGLEQFIGEGKAFVDAIKRIPVVASCDASVFITGETGTGKEICARAIHYLSPRAEKPFVPVNCGAIPIELIENELFGHEAGAFTGATQPSLGLIRQADGGTLFLDEVDSLPLTAQVKFLRLLQEKEVRALGGGKMHKADVRIVAASNAIFEEVLNTGKFRRDLYYRLNVVPINLPPLRERREDIPLLARHFQAKHARGFQKPGKSVSPSAMQKLMLYSWPGNVRELENVIERAVVLSEQPEIRGEDLLLPGITGVEDEVDSFQSAKTKTVAAFEKHYIERILSVHDGNITHAARAAHKNRRAFWQLMRKHKISPRARN